MNFRLIKFFFFLKNRKIKKKLKLTNHQGNNEKTSCAKGLFRERERENTEGGTNAVNNTMKIMLCCQVLGPG